MEHTKCTALTHRGTPCPARTWTIQVGKGMSAVTISRSEKWCVRHDQGEYNQVLLGLTQEQGRKLRFLTDWRRWTALRESSAGVDKCGTGQQNEKKQAEK